MLYHTAHVMTLANSIIGASILAMPFCFQKCGIVLAILLLILNNWITRTSCHYLIKSSLLTRRKSFEFLGFHAFGSSGKLFVEICIIGFLLGTCITYFVVVGDLGPQIITKMFGHDIEHLRFYFMLGITLICVLPLAMLKNVDSLSTVCTASIGFYVCLVLKVIFESETHILKNDWISNVVYWRPAGVLQCLPIFSMALSCQMQLFEVFKSVNNQSVEKLNGIVRDATWICTLVYIAVGFFGYVAFCTQAFSGNILLNFSPSFGSDVIKIGFILSVAFSFPLVIFPCRASIYSLLYRKGHTDASGGYIPETRFKAITTFIVGLTFCIALNIPSIELIIGLVGSTIGVAICIMFPAACFRRIAEKNTNKRSVNLSSIILVGSVCLMVLGTYANLQAIDEHSSGSHLDSESIQNILIRPTELPVIKEEIKKLLNEEIKVLEEDANKKENGKNSKLPQANDVKTENNLSRIEMQDDKKLNNKMEEGSVAVLPVKENKNNVVKNIKKIYHDEPIEKPVEAVITIGDKEKSSLIKILKPISKQNSTNNADIDNQKENINSQIAVPQNMPSINKVDINLPSSSNVQQQAIDIDAIKKDEDVAAEEHNVKIISTKNTEEELKKTQNELKKTKELLERKVDEIKEELFKQNKETQNLVAEKLGEVVEKVEKIEREVKKKDENTDVKIAHDLVNEKLAEVAKKVVEIEQKAKQKDSNSTLDTKTSNLVAHKADKINISEKKSDIELVKKLEGYEPLSYKTGELIDNIRNSSKFEHTLPLPLPLLINATRNKPNDIEPQQKLPLKTLNQNDSVEINADNSNSKLEPPSPHAKENVEAIRRDILEINTKNLETTGILINDLNETQKRFKRSFDMINVSDTKVIDENLIKENCLSEPQFDTLLQYGKQSIGRDLKSLQNDANENR